MSEDRGPDSLDAYVRKVLDDLGLWGFHPLRSKGSEPGWPDWTVIGNRVLFRELKTQRGRVTPEQRKVGAMLTAAGEDWAVWRPMQRLTGEIVAELRAITPGRLGTGAA
jgi:hypothetical protein